MSVTWEEYLSVRDADANYAECFQRCRESFRRHRENIRNLVERTSPAVVACLGSGVLNGITPTNQGLREANSVVESLTDSADPNDVAL